MHCTILVCKDSFNSADISIQTEKKNPMKEKRTFELKNKYAHSITLQIKYEWANIQHVAARSMSLLLFINELVLISNRFDSPEKNAPIFAI